VPLSVLLRVLPSAGAFGETTGGALPASIAIAGIAGLKLAALFGETCLAPGMAKKTRTTRWQLERRFTPSLAPSVREEAYAGGDGRWSARLIGSARRGEGSDRLCGTAIRRMSKNTKKST